MSKQWTSQFGVMNMTMRLLLFSDLQLADLNIIEHFWDLVEQEIHSMNMQLKILHESYDATMYIDQNLKEKFNLVEFPSQRIKDVLRAKGASTQY